MGPDRPDSTENNVGTNSTHTVSSSDVDSTIRVDVRFTDLAGNSEGPLPSEATAQVLPAAGPCPAGNDWCATMTVGTRESNGTFRGFLENRFGQLDETTIDYSHSFKVEQIYILEPGGFSVDLIFVKLDPYVPLGTVFNLGGTEFTANAVSRDSVKIHTWVPPRELRLDRWPGSQGKREPSSGSGERHRGRDNAGPDPFRGPRHGLGPAGKRVYREGGRRRRNEPVKRVGRHQNGHADPSNGGHRRAGGDVSYDMPASNPLQDVSGRKAPAFDHFTVTNNTEAVYRGRPLLKAPTPPGPSKKRSATLP